MVTNLARPASGRPRPVDAAVAAALCPEAASK